MAKLTKKFIEEELKNLPAKGSRIVRIGDPKGFGICITAQGAVSFVWIYYINGRERRIAFGRYPYDFDDPEYARGRAIELRKELRENGIDPLAEREEEKKEVEAEKRNERTIGDLADEYLKRYCVAPNKRPKSIHEDTRMVNTKIRPKFGNVPANEPFADLRRRLEEFRSEMQGSPVLANRLLALLSTMFNCAIEWGWRTDNPARGGKKGLARFAESKRDRFLDPEQVEKLTTALNDYKDQDAADVIRLLLLTGARPCEVLKVEWSHLDLKSKKPRWTKPKLATKTKIIHHVPLSAAAVEVLKRRRAARVDGCPHVFPGESGPGGEFRPLTTIRWAWVKICQAAGLGEEYEIKGKRGKPLKRWRPTFGDGVRLRRYDMRHTYASDLVNDGTSLEVIGENLGHTQLATTARYAHLRDAAQREANNSIGVKYPGLAGPKPTQPPAPQPERS